MDLNARRPLNLGHSPERVRSLVVREGDAFSGESRPLLRLYWDGARLVMAGNADTARNFERAFPSCLTCSSEDQAETVMNEMRDAFVLQTMLEVAFE